MKKVIQFHMTSFGEFYLLYDDGTMIQCEQEKIGGVSHLTKIGDVSLPE